MNVVSGDMIIYNSSTAADLTARLDKLTKELESLPSVDAAVRAEVRKGLDAARPDAGKGDKASLQTALTTAADTLKSATDVGAQGLELAKRIRDVWTWVAPFLG
ncbi:MAG: hypothetical protein HQL39_04160 [Alphaproteobacteria bacterium]|nr:hypothetical protein [Alphaproteobacteria bacterium]